MLNKPLNNINLSGVDMLSLWAIRKTGIPGKTVEKVLNNTVNPIIIVDFRNYISKADSEIAR